MATLRPRRPPTHQPTVNNLTAEYTPLVRVVTQHPSAAIRLAVSEAVLDVFSYPAELVRRCANPTCVLLFLDLNRNARRRWCDMSTCGNRAKAATHYQRRRNSAASSRSSPR
jgi:predicted RNA-binding Zn ribbon-like protein